ncbi:MAG: hypothetical protein J7J43_00320 [Thermosipho sp. (in: Bacteria)]|nr:hypothetical protein [Thermosipho sp. (in: thermotogales)]MCD6104217.1 hypothetical protein [Thermosipho sp. (in: thermotogales)]
MKIEREKKYVIPDSFAEKLKKVSLLKIGVIQWYIDDQKFIDDDRLKRYKKYRLRLVIDNKFNENWVIAIKRDLGDFKREEIEFGIEKSKVKISKLKNFKLTAKIRYFLTKPHSDPEIVLDEFLNTCNVNFDVNFLVEVETEKIFEKIEKEYGLRNFEVVDFSMYTNEKLAKRFNIESKDLIRCVYEELIKK